jgi:Ca-activated chloride channel family protein
MQHPTPTASRRARLILLAALVAATAAAGVAARILGPRPQAPGGAAVTATFGAGAVRGHLELDRGAVLRGGDGLVRALLTLEGRSDPAPQGFAQPTDLVVVLDRSGSMQGEPLLFAKAAVRELYADLHPEDRIALVDYSSGASVELPLAPAGPATRQALDQALLAIEADGGTEMSAGLDLADRLVRESRAPGRVLRVILLSDGHANQGDFSPEGLRIRAARAVAQEYVLSTVGVGRDFDEALMSSLADAGTGNFYYLPDVRELSGIFRNEFASARETVARGLRVALAMAPGVELVEASGYPLAREGDRVVFRPGDLFAGQRRQVWLTLRAPTDHEGALALGALSVAWAEPDGAAHALPDLTLPALACVAREEDYYASFFKDAYQKSSASQLGLLRERVAASLRDGRQDEAVAEVDRYAAEARKAQLRVLGAVPQADANALDALRATVAAPAAAEPEMQRQLGKQLLEEGRDARRAGAKR